MRYDKRMLERARSRAIGAVTEGHPMRHAGVGYRAVRTLGAALAAAVLLGGTALAQAPRKKDSRPFVIPKEATFKTEVLPPQARPGDTVTYRVTAEVAVPWHIYAQADAQPEQGPRATQFDFFDPAGLELVGAWTADPEPELKPEPAFDNQIYGSHEGRVVWSRTLKVPSGTPAGRKELKAQIYFMVCDPNGCKPPVYKTLPTATVTIVGGGEAQAAAAAPASGSPATPGPPAPAATAAPVAATPPRPVATIIRPQARPAASPAAPQSEVERQAGRGLIPFLLFSALGGLAALAMPCVWPMVPVTVNFFVKQGQARRGSATGLAITYSLAIIAIFTLVGLLFSAFLGASSLQRLANTAWLNLTVAGIFLLFGLSLLGLFELRLPSFLLNASAQNEGRGGLVGVIFMALTLTITSFTCTFPVVGGLLVLAASGSYLYPVLGLATFATVLALPFFLLALSPGMLQRLPRSGDWMNTVKVVGGLVEIGAAFKFLNTAEIALGATSDSAWIDAQVVLAIWVVLAVVCGLYLLGVFQTDHDHDRVKVGPIRMLCAAGFLFFGLYLSPALFGYPPQSRFYNLMVGLMPPDVGELSRGQAVMIAGGEAGGGEVKASSPDPKEASRQEKKFHGVQWGMSFEQGLERAKSSGKPVLVDFTGVNCANCRQMEREVMTRPEIRELLAKFVTVAQYTDIADIGSITPDDRLKLAEEAQLRQYEMVRDVTTPLYVVLTPDGRVVASQGGYIRADRYAKFLQDALGQFESGAKVARAESR
jgi:thiol:disulfide interchange protein DsbD